MEVNGRIHLDELIVVNREEWKDRRKDLDELIVENGGGEWTDGRIDLLELTVENGGGLKDGRK